MSEMLTVDLREFNEAMKECMANTKREASLAINKRAFFVVSKAIQETPVADARKMEYVLGVEGYKFKLNKSGKIIKRTKKAMIRKDSFASRIIRKRDKKEGRPPKTDAEMEVAVKKMIMGRKSSAGFIKQGWLDALIDFAKKVNFRISKKSSKRVVKKGTSVPATPSKSFVMADITNSALLLDSTTGAKSDPMSVAAPALQRAFARETVEMKEYLEKKLQASLNKNSATKA